MNFESQSVRARNVARIVGPMGILAALICGGSAGAEPIAAARNNPCVNRGADYVAVAGSDNCVRLGGRVRVDLRAAGNVSAYSGSNADGVQPAASRSHVRSNPLSSFIELFPR
jgi:hypothetical protein